jgi:hypothetical protein
MTSHGVQTSAQQVTGPALAAAVAVCALATASGQADTPMAAPIATAVDVCLDPAASGPERLSALDAAGWELTAPARRADFIPALVAGRALSHALSRFTLTREGYDRSLQAETSAMQRQLAAAEIDNDPAFWLRYPGAGADDPAYLMLWPPAPAGGARVTDCHLAPGRPGTEALIVERLGDPLYFHELDIGSVRDWPRVDGVSVSLLRPSPDVWTPNEGAATSDLIATTVFVRPAE